MKGYNSIPFPTPRAVLLVSAGMLLAIFMEWKLLILLDITILALFGIDYARIIRYPLIRVQRSHPGRLSQGVTRDIKINLFNKGDRSLKVQVRDYPPLEWKTAPILRGTAEMKSDLILGYNVTPMEKGAYSFGDITVKVQGPMGLMSCSIVCKAAADVKVYPNLPAFHYSDLSTYRRKAGYWGFIPTGLKGEGLEFESLREYIVGDDPRKIHWKATARRDRPIVQEHLPEKNQNVVILVDAGRLMCTISEGKTKMDHALEASIRLIHAALAGGDLAGILVFNDRVLSFIPPKKSPVQLQIILEETVSLTPRLVESQYEKAILLLKSRVKRRSLVVIFTDLLDDVSSENILTALSILRPTHLPLCVAVRESEWDLLFKTPPTDSMGAYKLAVMHDIIRQRGMVLKSLTRKGILAIDLTPSELSVKTLERYMEVKRKGLL